MGSGEAIAPQLQQLQLKPLMASDRGKQRRKRGTGVFDEDSEVVLT